MGHPKITLPKCYAFVGIVLVLLLVGGFYLAEEQVAPEKKPHVGETAAAAPQADPGSSGNVSEPVTEQETEEEAPKTSVKAPLFKPEGQDLQLTVKFRDDLQFRADKTGGLMLANGDRLPAGVSEALADLDLRFEPLYSPEMLTKLEDLAKRAEQRTGNKQPDFSATMTAVVNPNLSADERYAVANKLHALDVVDYVELTSLDQLPPPPGDIAPTSADLTGNQGYLSGNPGVDASFAWNLGAGYKGQGIRLSDCEYGYRETHEDLVDSDITNSSSAPTNPEVEVRGWDKHGTAVVGALAATHNGYGVSGIAADAEVHFYSEWTTNGYNRANSVAGAVTDSAMGDVVLLEMQTTFDGGYAPAETNLSVWNLVKTASDAGVIVVAAAGNGNRDMDSAAFDAYHARGDSGSIIVGAGSSTNSHNKMSFSTFGERVDVHAWGQNVASTGYGTLAEYGGDANQRYTGTFSGTSSASNVTAGVVTVIQSYCEQALGYRIDPFEMRALLKTTGVAQGSGGNIGPHVNIRNAIEYLQVGALPPFDVTASDDEFTGQVRITWRQMSGATGYQIFRGTTANEGSATLIGSTGSASSTTFNDNSSGNYFYWVRTVTTAGVGHFGSAEAGSSIAATNVENLTATDAAFADRVDLSWDSLPDALTYTVLRGTSSNVNLATEIATGITAATFSDTAAAQATIHYYWVIPVFSTGPGESGDFDSGYMKLGAPTGLAASDLTNQFAVHLSWQPLPGNVRYAIFRSSTDSPQSASPISTGVSGSSYLDTSAQVRVKYYYWIIGTSTTFGDSGFSLSDEGTRAAPQPSSPTDVTATDYSLSGRISLSWQSSIYSTNFQIYRGVGADATFSGPGTELIATTDASPYEDTDVEPGVVYRYWVQAVNESGPSSVLTSYDIGGANVTSELPGSATANPGSAAIPVVIEANGSYFGLVESAESSDEIVGWINSLKIRYSRDIPKFSARIYWGEKKVSVKGAFEPDGSFSQVVTIPKTETELTIQFQYAQSDGGFPKVTGTISDGSQTGTLDLNRRIYHRRNLSPEHWQGRWTAIFPADDENDDVTVPVGDGIGFASSNSSGKATFKIRLGDGTPLSIASYISGDGEIPLFKAYRRWGGKFAGEFRYNQIDGVSDWDGVFDWDRKPNEKSKLFAAGFETTVPGVPARFERSTKEDPYLLTELAPTELNTILILQGGNLGFEPGTHQTTWTDRNRLLIPGTKHLNGKISTKTGSVSGKLLLIDGETQRKVNIYGAVYQAQGLAVGYFLGEGETGRFVVIPIN